MKKLPQTITYLSLAFKRNRALFRAVIRITGLEYLLFL